METKACQNCKSDFTIESEDFVFYGKIKVPAPTFCPECRLTRRLSFFNLSKFYKRSCDKCDKKIISLHAPDKTYKVYCNNCWWADDWDGTEYAMNYDSSRPFLEQLIELRDKSTFMALETLHPSNVRTEYTNNSSYQKDCFMTMYADYNENCAYNTVTVSSKDCLDCYRIKECELLYECTGAYKSYDCSWSEEIDSCVDVHFSRSCFSSSHCIGCINLRGASYQILNEQYSKEDYLNKVKELKLDTYDGQQSFLKQIKEFWNSFPRRFSVGNSLNVNTTGEYVYESKNTHDAYLVSGAEDCRYVQYLNIGPSKDCYDYTGWGAGAELIYECFITGSGAYNNKFSAEAWPEAQNIEYSFFAVHGQDSFGCINLKRKKYCILNKQYPKEEYEILKAKIISDMKEKPWISKTGHVYSYGEFLPPEISPFGYNETVANEFYPQTKESALERGFSWYESIPNIYSIVLTEKDLPQTFEELNESIVNKATECSTCKKGFSISSSEFELLQKLKQPVAHQCPSCRHLRRFALSSKPGLYSRKCGKCSVNIKTSYSPDRPEIVYCEKCYQQEVH